MTNLWSVNNIQSDNIQSDNIQSDNIQSDNIQSLASAILHTSTFGGNYMVC